MPLLSLVRSSPACRVFLPAMFAVSLGLITSWATLTGHTASQSKQKAATSAPGPDATKAAKKQPSLNKNYGKLPLAFELNRGQVDAKVKYFSHGPGYNIFLTPAETKLVFRVPDGKPDSGESDEDFDGRLERLRRINENNSTREPAKLTEVTMRLAGADLERAKIEGVDELEGKVNYFIGDDSSKWLSNVPTFSKVAYRGAYPGIDVIYYGNGQQLEYDLVVSPGANPNLINLEFGGADNLQVTREGDLLLETSAGRIRQHKAVVYQEKEGSRKQVQAEYVKKGRNRIGFRVSRYDRNLPLVIDPRLAYLSQVNGDGDGYAIAVDANGFAFIAGTVDSTSLFSTGGVIQPTFGGGTDAFVTKLNQNGNDVLYSTYLGGASFDEAYGITVDSSGNAYVTGYGGAGFPTTAGSYQPTVRGGSFDSYVAKLNSTGSALIFSTFYGGNQYEEGDGIAVDASGNVIMVGLSLSTDLITTPGVLQTTSGGGYDAFAIKLNSNGSSLLYATYVGGGGADVVNGHVALDGAGNVYVSGQSASSNLPFVNPLMNPAGTDRGLFKSTTAGTNWSLSRSGLNSSYVMSMAIDKNTPAIMYAGTNGGVSKSTNGGASWISTPVTSGDVAALAIDPSNSSNLYAGTSQGIYKSTNSGASWANVLFGSTIQSFAIDPVSPTTVFAGTSSRLQRTTNGGTNWTQTSLPATSVRGVAIDPSNSLNVYVATSGGVSRSTNGGTNWTAMNTGLTSTDARSIAITPNAPSTIYVGTAGGVFKTTNAGANWSAVNNNLMVQYSDNVPRIQPITAIAIDPLSPSTLYAAPNPGSTAAGGFPQSTIFKSIDAGASWTGLTNGFGTLNNGFLSLAIDPSNPANVFAGNSGDYDGYVFKLNATGTSLVYSTYLSGARFDAASGVALDSSNSAYVIGYTQSPNFTTSPNAFQTTLRGFSDTFVLKLNPAGNAIAYSTYLGGALVDRSLGGIAVDIDGNAHVAGYTTSTDLPVTAGAFQSSIGNPGSATSSDEFITKLNSGGTGLLYSSYLGSGGNEISSQLFGTYLALDPAGNAYLLGTTSTPQSFPSFSFNSGGSTYVAKIDATVPTFSITGRLTTAANVPIAGGFVEATNGRGFFRSGRSDAQGFYSIISLPADDYQVAPDKFGSAGHYLWTPTTITFAGLGSNQTANFTGTQVYDIFGGVRHSTLSGINIFDVTVALTGSATASVRSDVNGNFVFRDLLPGNYTVTPTKTGFTFNPVNLVFNNLNADRFADFTTASTGSFFTVSGKAATSGNVGINGVSVVMRVTPQLGTGAREASTTTDANGNYSFTNLQGGGTYQFLPTKPLMTFTPQNQFVNNLAANQTVNFTGEQVTTGLVGRIAFLADTNPSTIGAINADGSGETTLASAGGQCSSDSGPAWSPDGSKLLFSNCTATDGTQNLFYMNADGSGLTAIPSSTNHDLFGHWSPDATRVTYTFGECSGSDTLIPDIFVTDVAGTIKSRLTNNPVVEVSSDWSPNGSSIIFVRTTETDCSSAEEGGDIYVMDSVGGNERRLTNTPAGEFAPVYSPDGLRVAYSAELFNSVTNVFSQNVYVMNADGTGQTKITPDTIRAETPTWSPDGTKLAFSAFTDSSSDQIYIINADGTGLVQITSGNTLRSFPAWQHSSISGKVTGSSNGLPITITLAGTLTRVTKTDANGNFIFGNLTPGGNYTVTPVSTAFGFTPAKIDINNLNGNQTANFTILPAVIPAPTPPLADDFAAGTRDPAKWNLGTQTQPIGAFDPQVSVVQQGGQLVVTPRSQTAGLHYNGYVAVSSFDFNYSKATVEVVQPATSGAETIFAIGSDLENYTRFVVGSGGGTSEPGKGRQPKGVAIPQLIFQVRIGGELTSINIPYDPVAHRFMRFRHEPVANSILFETSPDNVNFTVRHSVVLQKSVSALTAELSAGTSTATNPGTAVFDNFNLVTNTFQFQVTGSTINESANRAFITVTRSGDISNAATVDFATFDDTARQRTRYVPAVGTLSFAAGENSKTFSVLLEDNFLVEGSQALTLRLIDSFGGGLNSPGRATLTVDDNDSPPITTNPLDTAPFFVRQHYYDFLSRNPDQGGLNFWIGEITQCGSDQACINRKRIDVSNAFYFELEFQQTGSYVYRLYRVAFGNNQPFPNPRTDVNFPNEEKKLLSYNSFVSDRARVVGGAGLAQSQLNLANSFVKRPEFIATFPLSLDGPGFVDAVLLKLQTDVGVDLSSQRTALISLFNSGGRGAVIYRLADDNINTNPINNRPFIDAEYNRAFVATQYFGYLRRNADIAGFIFWLGQVNSGPLRDVDKQHAMVCSFVTSTEYQERFSLAVTHNNTECAH